jgi:hypothetical protein
MMRKQLLTIKQLAERTQRDSSLSCHATSSTTARTSPAPAGDGGRGVPARAPA